MKIIAVRISGRVGVRDKIERTLEILRLKIKHSAVLIEDTPEKMGMIEKVKYYIAYGEIDDETARLLVEKRGRLEGDKPVDPKRIEEFMGKFMKGEKGMEEIGIKPFFRLHPPKGGFKKSIKLPWPRGILGYQGKKINELIRKML
jgi:large subunit ribosomal protein L30